MPEASTESKRTGFPRRLATGLNILDLAIVMAIVTVLTGIAIPVFYSQPKITLDHASILLANDLRYAQNEAAICGEATTLTFAENGDGYSVNYKSGRPVANPVGGLDLVRQYSVDAIFRGVSLAVVEGERTQHFDRHGFALGDVVIEMRYEGDTRTLRMKKGSGLVHIRGLETQWEDQGL